MKTFVRLLLLPMVIPFAVGDAVLRALKDDEEDPPFFGSWIVGMTVLGVMSLVAGALMPSFGA